MDTTTILEATRTPHKHGQLVIRPSYKAGTFDSHAVDCPFPFRHNGCFWMVYVGWDGIGYQTGWARSHDLVNWNKEGLLIERGPRGSVTEFNVALTCILRDNDLYGSGTLREVGGRFVGTYHSYPGPGYESGPAVIGLCYSEDLLHWELSPPVLTPDASCPWEAGGLYKSWLMESGGIYYLFYNAKNRAPRLWVEQTGFATSRDLVHWERFPGNPVLRVGAKGDFDDMSASDPCVLNHRGTWLLFYYGNCSEGHARDGVAFSSDLRTWVKSGQILVDVGKEDSIDSSCAHKPGIIANGNRLYHFYCAVAPTKQQQSGDVVHDEVRGIALATS